MIGWVDASAGASGDMLLGALIGAGVPVEVLQDAVDAVSPSPVRIQTEQVRRAGFTAVRCHVRAADEPHPHRTWSDVSAIVAGSRLSPALRSRVTEVFARLAGAEGAVHGVPPERITFHEVGALDAIADVTGVCAGLVHLGLDRITVSPVAVGGGRVRSAHGSLPVPAPAVVELLRGAPTLGGPGTQEACTPTGAALLRCWADDFGLQPGMVVSGLGTGAGARDPAGHANVLRLLVGEAGAAGEPTETTLLLEANVDDQDPRLWPTVLADLLAAGAVDAWLVPILMKKGRPAHTVCALVPPEGAARVRDVLFAATATIGVRESTRHRTVLQRCVRDVMVRGHRIAVKEARRDGRIVNAQVEFDDIERAARALGEPVKIILGEAQAALSRSER